MILQIEIEFGPAIGAAQLEQYGEALRKNIENVYRANPLVHPHVIAVKKKVVP